MRNIIVGWLILLTSNIAVAQRECRSFEYLQQLIQADPSLEASFKAAENFTQLHESRISSPLGNKTITIPVIVHVLYHYPSENISDALVKSQIAALNRDYRKQNGDTTKIPAAFKPL